MKKDYQPQPETFDTWLPIFPGFYETWFNFGDDFAGNEVDDESCFREHYPECNHMDMPFIREHFWECVDYRAGNLAVAKACAEVLPELLPDFVLKCERQELKSPREYNFTNDSVNCAITVDLRKLRSYLSRHRKDLEVYLKRHYTSRDGFISFHPNSVDDWKKETDNFTKLDGHACGALLSFVAEMEGVDQDDMLECGGGGGLSEVFGNNATVDTTPMLEAWQRERVEFEKYMRVFTHWPEGFARKARQIIDSHRAMRPAHAREVHQKLVEIFYKSFEKFEKDNADIRAFLHP